MAYNHRASGSQDPKDIQLKNIDALREGCKNFMGDLHLFTDESEKMEMLQNIRKLLEMCAVSEHWVVESHRAAAEATREVSQEMDACKESGSILSPAETFLQMHGSVFDEKMNAINDDEIAANDTEVQVVQLEIQELFDKENFDGKKDINIDEDLVATEDVVSIVDPITKKLIKEPVRNKNCGHVYDKETILEMIKSKKRKGVRCPAMACANRDIITPQMLVDAPDVLREIRLQMSERS